MLGGTTSLLLLAVFAVVNVAVLVLRRDVQAAGGHFKTPTGAAGHRLYHLAVPGDAAVGPAVAAVHPGGHSCSSSASCCSSSRWRSTAGSAFKTPASRTRRVWAKRPTSSHPVEPLADRPHFDLRLREQLLEMRKTFVEFVAGRWHHTSARRRRRDRAEGSA